MLLPNLEALNSLEFLSPPRLKLNSINWWWASEGDEAEAPACQVRARSVPGACARLHGRVVLFWRGTGCAMWDALRLRGRYARAKGGMCQDVRDGNHAALGERAALQSFGWSAGVQNRDGQSCCQVVSVALSPLSLIYLSLPCTRELRSRAAIAQSRSRCAISERHGELTHLWHLCRRPR